MTQTRLLLGLVLVLMPSVLTADDAIPWMDDVDQAFEVAQRENKLVLIHFWHEQCGPCRRLESFVFKDGKVGSAVAQDYVAVKVNTRQNPEIAQRYRINSVPQDLVFLPNHQIVSQRISPSNSRGYMFMLSQVVKAASDPNPGADVAIARAIANNDPTEIPVVQNVDPRRRLETPEMAKFSHSISDRSANPGASGFPRDQYAGSPGPVTLPNADRQASPQTSSRQVIDNPHVPGAAGFKQATATQAMPQLASSTQPPSLGPSTQAIERVGFDQRETGNASAGPARIGGGSFLPQSSQPPAPTGPSPGQNNLQERSSQQTQVASAAGQVGTAGSEQAVANRAWQPTQPVQPVENRPAEAQAAPTKSQLPPLGLEGYCPIVLIQAKAWEEGDRRFGCVHRGQLYLFRSAEFRDQFMQQPDRYAPILSGYDPVLFAEEGTLVAGKREHGRFIDDRIVLFASEETFARFEQNPMRYIVTVREAMQTSDQVRR